jgi:methylglutaconyl-CoA hydratase
MSDLVHYDTEGRVVTITLNRPDKRNALNAALVSMLADALDRAEVDDAARAIVLTGAGSAFSAGADLTALRSLQDASAEENRADSRRLADLFRRIYEHPKPIIACVNGHAIGGGCGLAAACDFALASTDAKLGFTEVRLGFVPAIVSVFVTRKLGEAAARDLLLRGRLVAAGEAADAGLVTRAVAPDALESEARDLAREIARETSGTAVALTKELLANVRGMGLAEALDYAATVNALARSTGDCRAGVEAFLEGDDPPWKREAEDWRTGDTRKGEARTQKG